jgi:hypothetical protein
MENSRSNWQNSLNDSLVNRLTRPLRQPGMMKMTMSQGIINRCDRFLNRLPLLGQQMQRWGNTNTLSSSVPIIYAQSVSLGEESVNNQEPIFQPTTSQNQPLLIQRKLDSSQSVAIQASNNSRTIQDSTNSTSYNFGNENPQSLVETLINQNISSSEIPIVSPQSLYPELRNKGEMPLQAKFTDSQTSSPANANIPSAPILDGGINKTSISSSESPIVFPPQELLKTEEMPLVQEYASIYDEPLPIIQAKLSNSSLSASSVPVVNNLNTLVYPKQIQQNNNSEDLVSRKQESSTSQVSSINLPIVTVQPLTSKFNYSKNEEISFSSLPHSQNQPLSTVKTQPVNVSNSLTHQNISSFPLVSVTSTIKPHSSSQSSLPLAKTSSSSQNTSSQPNHNIISNQNSLLSPKSFVSPLSAKETSVSAMKTQSNTQQNIDVDSIASQVERKLMRRLVIESERRGKIR